MAESFPAALKNAVLGLMLIMECNKFLISSDLKARLIEQRIHPVDENVTDFNLGQVLGDEPFTEECHPVQKQPQSISDPLNIPERLAVLLEHGFRLLIITVMPHMGCDQVGDTYRDQVEGNVVRMFVCHLGKPQSNSTGESDRTRYGLLLRPQSAFIEFAHPLEEEPNFVCETDTTKPESDYCPRKIWAIARDLKMKLDEEPDFAWHSFCYMGCNENFRLKLIERALALKLTLAWFMLLVAGVLLILTSPRSFIIRRLSSEVP